jgi:hypothetical protein
MINPQPTPEMIEMRRKRAAELADLQWSTRGSHWQATFEGALAAIIETQELCAKREDRLAEDADAEWQKRQRQSAETRRAEAQEGDVEAVKLALRNSWLATQYDHQVHWDDMARAAIAAMPSREAQLVEQRDRLAEIRELASGEVCGMTLGESGTADHADGFKMGFKSAMGLVRQALRSLEGGCDE